MNTGFTQGMLKAAADWYYREHEDGAKVPAARAFKDQVYASPEHAFKFDDYLNLIEDFDKNPQKSNPKDITDLDEEALSNHEPKQYGSVHKNEFKGIPLRSIMLGGDGSMAKHIPIDAAFAVNFPNKKEYLDQTELKKMKMLQKIKMHLTGHL